MKAEDKNLGRVRRHIRLRKRVKGTAARPRLAVFRSGRYVYAQIIDDDKGATIVAASSLEKELKAECAGRVNKETAKAVGKAIAVRAKEAGIKAVVFDRGGFLYHGRVKCLADSARENGLEF